MSIRRVLAVVVSAALCSLALLNAPHQAGAAVITWGSAQSISGTADVITTGSLFASANFNGSDTTVNGVTFNAFPLTGGGTSQTIGNIGIVSVVGSGTGFIPSNLTTSGTPFSTLPVSYKNLLAPTLRQTAPGNRFEFTLSNLLVGGSYSIQYWVNDPRTNAAGSSVRVGGAVNLDPNVGDVSGGLGQWVEGQFIADGTSQTFTVAPVVGSNNTTYANAMQVRLLAVPEPASIALAGLGVGCAGFSAWRRRAGRQQARRTNR
jgi:hypothetical protein